MQQQVAQSTEVQSSLGTRSPSPECSESSIRTQSILTTSHVTMTSQAPSEEFFTDNLEEISKGKKVQKCQKFGSMVGRHRNCEVKKATKNPRPGILNNHIRAEIPSSRV